MFYVYVIRDPRPDKNNAPIYVGKGKGRRADFHLKRATNPVLARTMARVREDGFEASIEKVRSFEREADAFAYEIELIALYGRRDLETGTLCNLTAGGEGVDSEGALRAWADPVHRAKRIAGMRRVAADPENQAKKKAGCKRRSTDPAYLAKLSAALQLKASDPAYLASLKAAAQRKAADPEWKAKVAAACADPEVQARHLAAVTKANRLKATDPAFRAKQKAATQLAANNPKRRAAIRAAWADPERRANWLAARADAASRRTAAIGTAP